jgi:hypothetical protein
MILPSCFTLLKAAAKHNAVCQLCKETLQLKPSGLKGYNISSATAHLGKRHGESEGKPYVLKRGASALETMQSANHGVASRNLKQMKISVLNTDRAPPTNAEQLAAQAHIYMYSPTTIPKTFFRCPEFRKYAMLLLQDTPKMAEESDLGLFSQVEWGGSSGVPQRNVC